MRAKNTQQVIGLIGFGVVGESLYHVLRRSPTPNAYIKSVCDTNPERLTGLEPGLACGDAREILADPEINLVVELINDADAAFQIVRQALEAGKSVVTGNKKMIAHHLEQLLELQERTGSALLYDASACGSIPVIRSLEEYYDNDLLYSITGILNGSSNYILTKVFNEGMGYAEALRQAQELGFAEADPSMDVDGFDSLFKLVILSLHGFGALVRPERVFNAGISRMAQHDIRYARQRGYRIKLIAQAQKLSNGLFTLMVMPKLVAADELIYSVENEYNGVIIEGQYYEKQFMFGKGAGGFPTGSSVLSDITARMHGYRYEYKKRRYFKLPSYTTQVQLEVYLRYQNLQDYMLFDFDEVTERYTSAEWSYVVGKITLENLIRVKHMLPRTDVFLALHSIQRAYANQ